MQRRETYEVHMSPTLLEITMILLLIGVGWRLGIELLPAVRSFLYHGQRRLEQIDATVPKPAAPPGSDPVSHISASLDSAAPGVDFRGPADVDNRVDVDNPINGKDIHHE
ncbi:MAG: hypothetical protein R2867_47820 [Caldilineaceae bacterium]